MKRKTVLLPEELHKKIKDMKIQKSVLQGGKIVILEGESWDMSIVKKISFLYDYYVVDWDHDESKV